MRVSDIANTKNPTAPTAIKTTTNVLPIILFNPTKLDFFIENPNISAIKFR